uniref:SH2 domain-containing protein n=1 Tax=Gasterosteus aculeatus aculeatus TaxID=481459 RepID=A0AAQ4PG83_GASAC
MAKIFGKLKNLGPTAPPRRTDDCAGNEWPQKESDDDEGDMYEEPPCERQTVNRENRQREEELNVYLERPAAPSPPQRPAALPPRPAKPSKPQQHGEDFFFDPQTKNAPEINRTEKPGRKNMMPTPLVRSAPVPNPASNTEEDVYLDPNEEQNSPWLSSNELETASTVEVRHKPLLSKPPPPTPSIKPPLPAKLKQAKNSPPVKDGKPAVSLGGMKATKQWVNEDKEWFAGNSNRKTAEDLLLRVNKDGAFLIRHSSAQGSRQPYTLAVLYQQKVYNIPIRFLGETRGYALGKEGKKTEEIFGSLDEMISHHKNNQLLLIDSKSQAKHTTYLTYPARPSF